jgi:hypothetical protein
MRVLICKKAGRAFGYITDGWINCLQDRQHIVKRWDGTQASWDDFDPDLYIGSAGHKQPIPAVRRAKVALHVNTWGPVSIDNNNESKENISESPANIKWTIERKPDVVFGYGFYKDEELWSYWSQKASIPWVPMPTAGDKTIYTGSVEHDKKYDIIYLGGRWPYKSETIDNYLLPVLRSQLNCKLYGWGEWPPNLCGGELPQEKATEFLRSGKVGPCICEKHTLIFGIDIPERIYKVVLSGTLAIHDPIPNFQTIFPDAVIGDTPKDYLDKCCYYAAHDSERQELARKQQEFVLNNHTYHHRMHVLLKSVGLVAEAQTML